MAIVVFVLIKFACLTFAEKTILNYYSNLEKIDWGTQARNVETVYNFYTIISNFVEENCLIVINNYANIALEQTKLTPIILRQIELADFTMKAKNSGERFKNVIWIPSNIPKFNINVTSAKSKRFRLSHPCPISKFYTPFSIFKRDSNYCVSLNPNTFFTAIKPWQCEIQVELFMPDDLFQEEIGTPLFKFPGNTREFQMNRLRSPVRILINTKSNVTSYPIVSLLSWITRNQQFKRSSLYTVVNDVQVIAHVSCQEMNTSLLCKSHCIITNMITVAPCIPCRDLYTTSPIDSRNIMLQNILKSTDYHQTDQHVGDFLVNDGYERASALGLAEQIKYFADHETEAIQNPHANFNFIRNKYPEKLKILGFAYASLYILLLGNLTSRLSEQRIWNPDMHHFSLRYARIGIIGDIPFATNDGSMKIENKFGNLRFVSCGYKGIEPFPFSEFVSIFDTSIWIWIPITVLVTSFSIVHLQPSSFTMIGLNCFYFIKVLVEQGDPFPSKQLKIYRLRFVICGVLLAGIVLSNAYKSTNVYNIVTPRNSIPYRTINELVHDKFSVYGRLVSFRTDLGWGFWRTNNFTVTIQNSYELRLDNSYHSYIIGFLETWLVYNTLLSREFYTKEDKPDEKKLLNYVVNKTHSHPNHSELLLEPLKLLEPLETIGMINGDVIRQLEYGNSIQSYILNQQNNLVMEDLLGCNKTAWILPDYVGHNISRYLRKLGKHSDVGIHAYTKTHLSFHIRGLVPTSLLQRFGWMSSSGLLDWWPSLINRTDLTIPPNLNTQPTKPSMTGNIQIVFMMWASALVISICWLIIELRRRLGFFVKVSFLLFLKFVRRKLKTRHIEKCIKFFDEFEKICKLWNYLKLLVRKQFLKSISAIRRLR